MEKIFEIKNNHLASNIKSGELEVLSTPYLLSYFENISMEYIKLNLNDNNFTSVGVKVDLKHLKPSLENKEIKCIIKNVINNNSKWIFELEAYCSDKLIGICNHTRYVVNKKEFEKKL